MNSGIWTLIQSKEEDWPEKWQRALFPSMWKFNSCLSPGKRQRMKTQKEMSRRRNVSSREHTLEGKHLRFLLSRAQQETLHAARQILSNLNPVTWASYGFWRMPSLCFPFSHPYFGRNLLHLSWYCQLGHLPSPGQRLASGYQQAIPPELLLPGIISIISSHGDAQLFWFLPFLSCVFVCEGSLIAFGCIPLGEQSFLCLVSQFLSLTRWVPTVFCVARFLFPDASLIKEKLKEFGNHSEESHKNN